MQPYGCMTGSGDGSDLQGAGRPASPATARPAARAQRPEPARAVRRPRPGAAVGDQAPRRAAGRRPGRHQLARPGEAAPPQRRPDQRHRRPVAEPLSAGARRGARRSETHLGGEHRGRDVVRLRHLYQDHARAAVAGTDRAGIHVALLEYRPAVRLAGRLAGAVEGRSRRGVRGPRHARARGQAVRAPLVHLAQLSAGPPGTVRLERRAARRVAQGAALQGDLRPRAGGQLVKLTVTHDDFEGDTEMLRPAAGASRSPAAGRCCWPASRPCSRPAARSRSSSAARRPRRPAACGAACRRAGPARAG